MNNQAPELSREARRLIDEARGADDPTADDQARVKARWLASIAAVAGVSSLTEAARAAGGIGWGLKAAGAALVIAAGAIGLNFALGSGSASDAEKTATPLPTWAGSTHERFQKTARERESARVEGTTPHPEGVSPADVAPLEAPTPVTPTPAAPTPTAPTLAPQPLPQEAAPTAQTQPTPTQPQAEAELPSTPEEATVTRGAARARSAPRAVVARASGPKAAEREKLAPPAESAEASAAPGPNGQLGEELSLLAEVRSSIQEGAGARALELLSRYEARFGQPILGMEADALRVDALCKAGQRDAARESAQAFRNEWPGSPLERRVSAACP